MNLSYSNDPFPHIKGSIDQDLYEDVIKEWDNITHKEYNVATGNRSNIPLENLELFSKISSIMMQCYEVFANDFIVEYPKLADKQFKLKPRILYSENKASELPYKIRGWHLDTGDKFLVGLWYFKHQDEEENSGGDLLLMNPTTKKTTVIKYEANSFIIFPNLTSSWHAVTPRKPSKYPRRYINLLLESPDIRLHNYMRTGNTVDDEFRGKLENYYK